MPETYARVETTTDLDRLFAQSDQHDVVLFNHDPWCPISGRAIKEMNQVAHDVALIDVSRFHAITSAVAERTRVRHESPQVLILRRGQATWSASHFAITAESVNQAVSATDSDR